MAKFTAFLIMAFMLSATAYASDRHWDRGDGYGYYKKHHRLQHNYDRHNYYEREYRPVERVYYREEVRYVPQPIVRYRRYQSYEASRYRGYQRHGHGSVEGLIGGTVGGVVGYQLGQGNPLATGIGAAFGALIGNKIHH